MGASSDKNAWLLYADVLGLLSSLTVASVLPGLIVGFIVGAATGSVGGSFAAAGIVSVVAIVFVLERRAKSAMRYVLDDDQ